MTDHTHSDGLGQAIQVTPTIMFGNRFQKKKSLVWYAMLSLKWTTSEGIVDIRRVMDSALAQNGGHLNCQNKLEIGLGGLLNRPDSGCFNVT